MNGDRCGLMPPSLLPGSWLSG